MKSNPKCTHYDVGYWSHVSWMTFYKILSHEDAPAPQTIFLFDGVWNFLLHAYFKDVYFLPTPSVYNGEQHEGKRTHFLWMIF